MNTIQCEFKFFVKFRPQQLYLITNLFFYDLSLYSKGMTVNRLLLFSLQCVSNEPYQKEIKELVKEHFS